MTTLLNASDIALLDNFAADPQCAEMAQRTRAWWQATRDDGPRFATWLQKQLHGERTAATRILWLRDHSLPRNQQGSHDSVGDRRAWQILSVIAAQEQLHADWVAELLRVRDIAPTRDDHVDRYWQQTLISTPPQSFSEACAVGAHAERMRLLRIETIVADAQSPADVRATFARILGQERFHARAFAALAGPAALRSRQADHLRGARWLGLLP